MSIKSFFLKQLLKRQMKNVPEDQQEQIFTIIEKNPDFFMQIANEVQEKVKGGMAQQEAMMAVMKVHESKLKEILGK